MILVGRLVSPFVRRVAISMRILELSHEAVALSTMNDREQIRAYNPLGRVPALVLPDGEVLIDSTPILDYLDELAGPERALIPVRGEARRQVLKLVAYAMGVMEKTLSCYIERNLRPAETRHDPLLNRFADQAVAGLMALDVAVPADGWIYGETITQADISAICALDYLQHSCPERLASASLPGLMRLRETAYRLPAFRDTRPE